MQDIGKIKSKSKSKGKNKSKFEDTPKGRREFMCFGRAVFIAEASLEN